MNRLPASIPARVKKSSGGIPSQIVGTLIVVVVALLLGWAAQVSFEPVLFPHGANSVGLYQAPPGRIALYGLPLLAVSVLVVGLTGRWWACCLVPFGVARGLDVLGVSAAERDGCSPGLGNLFTWPPLLVVAVFVGGLTLALWPEAGLVNLMRRSHRTD